MKIEKEILDLIEKNGGVVKYSAQNKPYFEYENNVFLSLNEFADFYKINYYVFLRKLNKGISLKDIIDKVKNVKDHLGNSYPSTKAMCDHYGISSSLFTSRVKRNWDIQKALETK